MEMWTTQGHVVGMLDRDQRTAKIFSFDRHVVLVKKYEDSPDQTVLTGRDDGISHSSVPRRTSPHSSCKTRKSGHSWKSLHRLKHALIFGAYLGLIAIPSVDSAPVSRRPRSSMEASTPKWINPCGMSGANGPASDNRESDKTLIKNILGTANIAQANALTFKEDFVRQTFHTDVQTLHNWYKDKDYEWLPTQSIPKKLNEAAGKEHVKGLEFKALLPTIYEYLQKIAVGLEQVVWDQKGEFKSKFMKTEDQLRSLLCEIYTAMIEHDLPVEDNVTRDVMGPEFRNMDNTNMNIRNWIIYRDYLNTLEYIIQVFEHFQPSPSD